MHVTELWPKKYGRKCFLLHPNPAHGPSRGTLASLSPPWAWCENPEDFRTTGDTWVPRKQLGPLKVTVWNRAFPQPALDQLGRERTRNLY